MRRSRLLAKVYNASGPSSASSSSTSSSSSSTVRSSSSSSASSSSSVSSFRCDFAVYGGYRPMDSPEAWCNVPPAPPPPPPPKRVHFAKPLKRTIKIERMRGEDLWVGKSTDCTPCEVDGIKYGGAGGSLGPLPAQSDTSRHTNAHG